MWRPKPMIRSFWLRYGLVVGAVVYLRLALGSIDVNRDRVARGWERAKVLFEGFARPDFASRWEFIQVGILESLAMTVVATALGIVLSIPFAFGAARNIASPPVYLLCRGVIAVARSFQEIVIAIFFVVMVGFGPLAGVLTLAFASIGFLGKLLAEDIEDIEPLLSDLERILTAEDAEAGMLEIARFAELWGEKYPEIAAQIAGDWPETSDFFADPAAHRKVAYRLGELARFIVAVKEVLEREEGFSSEEELMDALEPVFLRSFLPQG